jgi:hypothetical protein
VTVATVFYVLRRWQQPVAAPYRERSRAHAVRHYGLLVTLLGLTFSLQVFGSGTVEFKLVTQKTVTDARELAVIRDELLLGIEPMERIVITDALNDGFDENDYIQIYPSGRVVRVQRIEARLDSLFRSYKLPPNVEIHESKQFYTKYDSTSRRTYGGQALGYGLLGGIGERLYRGYRGSDVEGYFKMSSSGMSLQAWNFDSTKVGFPPPDAPRSDTFYVYLHDTIRVSEVVTVAADPVVIRDTVYIPSEFLKKRSGFFYREALGMIGGGYNSGLREASRGRVTLGAGNEWDFGVWDRWISGRQDVDSRMGLRFVSDMAPWTNDTLSPRFLASSFETMYIFMMIYFGIARGRVGMKIYTRNRRCRSSRNMKLRARWVWISLHSRGAESASGCGLNFRVGSTVRITRFTMWSWMGRWCANSTAREFPWPSAGSRTAAATWNWV